MPSTSRGCCAPREYARGRRSPDVEAREGVIQAEAQLIRETPVEDRPLLLDMRRTFPDLNAFYDHLERRRPPDEPIYMDELRREVGLDE